MKEVRFIVFSYEEVNDFLHFLPDDIQEEAREYIQNNFGRVTEYQMFSNLPDKLSLNYFRDKTLEFGGKYFVKHKIVLTYFNGIYNIGLDIGTCERTLISEDDILGLK